VKATGLQRSRQNVPWTVLLDYNGQDRMYPGPYCWITTVKTECPLDRIVGLQRSRQNVPWTVLLYLMGEPLCIHGAILHNSPPITCVYDGRAYTGHHAIQHGTPASHVSRWASHRALTALCRPLAPLPTWRTRPAGLVFWRLLRYGCVAAAVPKGTRP